MAVTDADLNVDIVAPLTVPQTTDLGLIQACAGKAPALSSAVIFNCRSKGPGVNPVNASPV